MDYLGLALKFRFNEKKIKEMSLEENDAMHQKRASRLDNWMKLAREEASKHSAKVSIPDSVEFFGIASDLHCFTQTHH